jgi:hypothetical protein
MALCLYFLKRTRFLLVGQQIETLNFNQDNRMQTAIEESADLIPIHKAYFIKLGYKGCWEQDSIAQGIARIGWGNIPIGEITSGAWGAIEQRVRDEQKDPGAATRDFDALRNIANATQDDVWITFYSSRMWWSRLVGPVESDPTSKFRRTVNGWSDANVEGAALMVADLPGKLTQVQRFSGTACAADRDVLARVLNARSSSAHLALEAARTSLIEALESAIQELYWKDFENLTDLLFRHAGWRRLSVVGESMKYSDMELLEPINRDRYQVQVKSKCELSTFEEYRAQFDSKMFRKLFFVVHTPSAALAALGDQQGATVELIFAHRLAEMVLDAGLAGWLSSKVR